MFGQHHECSKPCGFQGKSLVGKEAGEQLVQRGNLPVVQPDSDSVCLPPYIPTSTATIPYCPLQLSPPSVFRGVAGVVVM